MGVNRDRWSSPRPAYSAGRTGPELDTTASAPVEDWHLIDAVRVLYKRRGTAALTFVAVLGAVALYVLTSPQMFEARVQLLIESDQPQVIVFKDAVQEGTDSQEYYETQVRILQSRSLARQTMTDLNLWGRPEFVPGAESQPWLQRTITRIVDTVTGMLPAAIRPAPDRPPVEQADATEAQAQARALTAFLTHLEVAPVRASRLVDVKFQSPDPELAANVVNALAQAYIDQDLLSKVAAAKQVSDVLEKQLQAQRKQVEESESRLQQYRERTAAISTGQRETLGSQKMAGLNNALVQATAARLEKEAMYGDVEKIAEDPAALETFPAISSNALVQTLKTQLGRFRRDRAQLLADRLEVKHPKVQAVDSLIRETESELRVEIDKAVESLRREYQAAVTHENTVRNALAEQTRESVQQQQKEATYDELERAARADRQIFDSLVQRAKETGVTGTLRGSNIRIVDAADVPTTPVSPRVVRSMMLASVAGLVLAIGFAFFFEYFDNRIKTPDEIKTYLGLKPLGLVPLTDAPAQNSTPLLLHPVPPNFAEAFRIVRTNVLFTQVPAQKRSLAVTSTSPGEGKTMVACNLAIGLAMTGERVLLIDADMRRPRVHTCLGVPQGPGLSDLITGQTTVKESVRPSTLPTLWVLPCGTIPANPAELLSTARFRKLVQQSLSQFDWVLIDTPPVLAVTDGAIIANLAGAVLFVVGAEATARPTAQTAIDQLAAAKANVIGAVLNRVNLKRNGFFYFNYYRRDYEHYYASSQRP
jgi:capsular exopolysaccharide synthesis family protein